MPQYRYRCPANGRTVDVVHRMVETLTTWGEVCARAGLEPGPTAAESPVHRILFAPHLSGSSEPSPDELRSKGFTKLVRREKGVYENVTAREGQARFVRSEE